MTGYRSDPLWQAAQAQYIEPTGLVDPDERMKSRMTAAQVMYEIERRYDVAPLDADQHRRNHP